MVVYKNIGSPAVPTHGLCNLSIFILWISIWEISYGLSATMGAIDGPWKFFALHLITSLDMRSHEKSDPNSSTTITTSNNASANGIKDASKIIATSAMMSLNDKRISPPKQPIVSS